MTAAAATGEVVTVDVPAGDRIAAMRIGGMSVLERTLREAARAGATRAIVRADRADLPALPALALTVDVAARDAALPAGARALTADTVAGVRVTDRASARAAMQALLRSCRRPYDGVADRHVIRHVSLRLTGLLTRTPITPNQITIANVVTGLAACWFASRGTHLGWALAGALMFLQLVLDSSDGELARIRHRHSRFGMTLDNLGDDVVDNLYIAMLGVGLGGRWAWIGPIAAGARGLVALWIYIDVARQRKFGDVMAFRWWFDTPDDDLAERFTPRVTPLSVVRALGRRDLYGLIFAVTCVIQLPQLALGLGLFLCAAYAGLGVAHLAITRGRVSSAPRP